MHRRTLWALLATTALVVTGCGGTEADCGQFCSGNVSETAPTSMSMGGSGTETDTGTDGASTSNGTDTSGSGPGTGVDTESGSDTGTGGTDTEPGSGSSGGNPIVPCIGVNFVFVVDNSVGMAEEQARFQATAFQFVSQVATQAASAMGNVSIAVLTTDEPEFVVPTGKLEPGYSSGFNWMRWDPASVDGNATLQAELNTAVMVGESGDPNERPMDMLLEALTGDTSEGFNAEFVEEDALLVVVLVTDEEDDVEQPTLWGSDGDPDAWVDTLAELKEGIRKDIAVLSIVPDDSMKGCADDTDAARLKAFTEAFPTSATHDVCQFDYSAFLISQVQPVVDACNEFSPP